MRKIAWTLAAAMMAIAGPAAAQELQLVRGEEVAFTLEDGKFAGVKQAPAIPTPFETAIGQQFSGMEPPKAPVPEGTPIHNGSGLPDADVPEAGKIRVRFLRVPGTDHSLLVIHNGYARALVYRARISSGGSAKPTDVCLVMPGKPGVEHWPYAITAIDVSDFRFVAWKPEDGIPCK